MTELVRISRSRNMSVMEYFFTSVFFGLYATMVMSGLVEILSTTTLSSLSDSNSSIFAFTLLMTDSNDSLFILAAFRTTFSASSKRPLAISHLRDSSNSLKSMIVQKTQNSWCIDLNINAYKNNYM